MAVRFTAMMNAVNRGLETLKPGKGADMIEDWETALSEVDAPGAKGIARDLGALRKQLEKDQPDGERVLALVHRLGEATTKIADKADKQGDKLKQLGQALSETGEPQGDEEEDTEAAKAPKRKPTKAKDEGKKDDAKKDEGK